MKVFDAIVIGAGLAGLQCAKLLSSNGASVLLVDRKTDLTVGVHTTGIFVRKTFEDFDFPAGVLGQPIRDVTLYSPSLNAISLQSGNDEFRVGDMGLLYEKLLSECVENGVEFANSTRYVSAEMGSGDVLVRLERRGVRSEAHSKVLIGADGAASRVAQDLGLGENKEWIVGCEEVYRHRRETNLQPRLHCFLDAKLAPGYLAWIADDGRELHIGVGGYVTKFEPKAALKEFRERIARRFVDLQHSEPAETRGGRIPVGGVLRRIANQHGLLVGDAAGAVSPLTAGGLDPCLRLSSFAAAVIVERLRANDPQLLLNYSGDAFRSRFISRLWMRRLIRVFSNQISLKIGCAFLRTPIGKKLAHHVFFGRSSFPDVEIKTVEKGEAVLAREI
jgi:flavin-dependent dehydrogenase